MHTSLITWYSGCHFWYPLDPDLRGFSAKLMLGYPAHVTASLWLSFLPLGNWLFGTALLTSQGAPASQRLSAQKGQGKLRDRLEGACAQLPLRLRQG